MAQQKRTPSKALRILPDVRRALRTAYGITEQQPDQKSDWDALLDQIK